MLKDVELPIFPEICVIHKMDENFGVEPYEIPFLIQSLIIRGWVWRMPAKYQQLARQLLGAGVISDVKPTDEEIKKMGKNEKVSMEIEIVDGRVNCIKASGGSVDVKVIDQDKKTTVSYSSYGVDDNPIWVGDDTVEEDDDSELG